MSNRLKFLVMTVLAVSACASGGGAATDAEGGQRAGDAGSAETANPAYDAVRPDLAEDLKLLASQERIRPANFYKLERSYEPAVCDVALKSLNKPYAVPDDLKTFFSPMMGKPLGYLDNAAHQAAYYLGTSDNVRWSWREEKNKPWETGPNRDVGVATLDFFNDGVDRIVTLSTSSLTGHLYTLISVRDLPLPYRSIHFSLPESGQSESPDKDRLNAKLEYSAKDIIRILNEYYTILMPISTMFNNNYIYLFSWRGQPYYGDLSKSNRKIICVFAPVKELHEPG